jgi:hypothetical protein
MVILRVGARVLFGPVADAESETVMLAFGNSHARRHLEGLLFRIYRRDRGELEELHAVEPPLRVLDEAAPIQVARREGKLPANDVFADALVSRNLDRTEHSHGARCGSQGQRRLGAGWAARFLQRDLGVGEAVIAQLVDRQFLRGLAQLAIARLPNLERGRLLQALQVFGGDDIEAVELQ